MQLPLVLSSGTERARSGRTCCPALPEGTEETPKTVRPSLFLAALRVAAILLPNTDVVDLAYQRRLVPLRNGNKIQRSVN